MPRFITTFVLAALFGACGASPPAALRDGDIIFHTSRSAQSIAIQRATHSPYSHMGMILYRNGQPQVFEAVGSDSRIYCSELVWKAYERALSIEIGNLQRLREFDLSDPEVQRPMRERYGADLPLDEMVISPAAMFDARNVVTVVTR